MCFTPLCNVSISSVKQTIDPPLFVLEAAAQGCSVKNVFLKIY